ncbi:acetolactate synthase [Bordetella genomosp. 8]|uniref:Acetolactate synthase n=1 Tax=Bordetella genomosp. 8 TaxID=1416806 RepID=A0A1W6YHB5_9BORD|nr:thiamine pyrophosphate-requiring protein [Bordetella genomosp. 8]ARP80398.1 acetolactate synthase [Bordetella genomosp. 8]
MDTQQTGSGAQTRRTTAHYFLEGLADTGVEYIFSNLGTDHVTLIEELARWQREGRRAPATVLCPHENVAMHMAAGYAAMTGRGQAVMVHVDAGTANAAMGMHNMFRSRLPVMLMAGKAPYTLRGELPASRDNYVHFVQDPFDIGSLVRPYVKWEYTLPSGVVAKEALRRAHTMMQSDPPGPVYMTLPRETLAESWPETNMPSYPADRYGAVMRGGIDAEQAEAIARDLIAAQLPIAVTAYLGRNPQAVEALTRLADRCGMRVYEFMPTYMNVPRDAACFGGFDPKAGLAGADFGMLLDVDVPWLPAFAEANPRTAWTHIDVDAVKQDFPMWGFATHRRLQADCGRALEQVLAAVERLATADFDQRARQRREAWEADNAQRRAMLARAASQPGAARALSAPYVCAAVGRAIASDDVVVNEAIRNSPAVLGQIPRSRPLSLLGCSGGGLGYSGGMALGVKLARPHARVVQIVGDGGFHFSTPTSVYAVAQQYGLPIFTVVLDNGGWQAVKEAVLRVYPEGEAAGVDNFQARLANRGERRFDQVAMAFGAHGEYVDEPTQLEAAIARCLAAVDAGQAAVMHVRIAAL